MRQYDWERRQKTMLERLIKGFKQQLQDNGFTVKDTDFVLAIRVTAASDGFFKTIEYLDGILDNFSEYKEFKDSIYDKLQDELDDSLQDELDDANREIDDLTSDIYERDCEIERLSNIIDGLKNINKMNKDEEAKGGN